MRRPISGYGGKLHVSPDEHSATRVSIALFAVLAVTLTGGYAQTASQTDSDLTRTPAYRTYGLWRSSRIRGGGYLQQVVFCPSEPARMYLTVDVGGDLPQRRCGADVAHAPRIAAGPGGQLFPSPACRFTPAAPMR